VVKTKNGIFDSMSVSPQELPVWKQYRCSGVLPGVFCRGWIGSAEGYNGLVVGMSHDEEHNGWEEPILLDSGEWKKGMFKLSPQSASKLPEGSIPPADLGWSNSASSELQADACLRVRASSASK